MEKVDRLGWAAGIGFSCEGVRLGVRVSDPALLPRVEPLLPPGWRADRRPVERMLSVLRGGRVTGNIRRFHILYADSTVVTRGHDVDEVLASLARQIDLYISFAARRRIYVRAGVAAWQGRAILVTGPEGSGRATLVRALAAAGATLYSEDYAVVDGRGRVHAHRRGAPALPPLPVGLIAVTRYVPGARWTPVPLSAGQAALELVGRAEVARVRPGDAMAAAARAASAAVLVQARRGEAAEAAAALLAALGECR